MKEFLSSPVFLEWAAGLIFVVVVITLLWRNTVWEARGITPVADVARLRTRITGMLPKSLLAWCIFIGVTALVVVGLWVLTSTPGSPSGPSGTWSASLQAPSPKAVWRWTKNYWLWIALFLAVPFFVLGAMKKPWTGAVQSGIVVLGITLFIAIPLVDLIWGDEGPSQQAQQACSHFSSTKSGSCRVVEDGVIVTSTEAFPDGKFELCYLKPEKAQMTQEWLGPNAIKFKSQKGEFFLTYKLVERKTLINGNCPTSL